MSEFKGGIVTRILARHRCGYRTAAGRAGYQVVVNYRAKAPRANKIVASIEERAARP